MVTRTCAHYSIFECLRGNRTDLVVSSTYLVGTDHLKVLTLEKHLGIIKIRKIRILLKRSRF